MLGAMDALTARLKVPVFALLDQGNVVAAAAIVVGHRAEADAAFWQDLLHWRIVETDTTDESETDDGDADTTPVDVGTSSNAADIERSETDNENVADQTRVDVVARVGNGRGKR